MDSYAQPAWVRAMLERIAREGHAQFAFVVLNDGGAAPQSTGPGRRILNYWKQRDRLLYALFGRLDRRRSLDGPSAFEETDVSDLLADVPSITVSPRRTRFSDYLSEADVQAVRDQRLDVLIRLGFRILRGEILDAAEVGVWSFHHGDNRRNRGGPAGTWEVLLQWPVTGSMLQILNEDLDNGLVLARSWSATSAVSARANRNALFWKTLSLMPRKLEELRRSGRSAFLAAHRAAQDPASFYSNPLYLLPTNRELWRPFWRLNRRLVGRKWVEQRHWHQWQLRYQLADGFGGSLWRFKKLVPPSDRFWADPHILRRDGRYYVFLEEYLYAPARGRIAVLTLDEDGNVSEPRPVLERPYHLSYPFVFEWRGGVYMIPETAAARTVELYRCVRFPDEWTLEREIMTDVDAVDVTLLEHEGRWWMFANVRENPGASFHDELFVFHTDDPVRGEWVPHLANPVVSDVRRARPAGSFVRTSDALFRPAQDCAPHYGWGMRVHRVLSLTPEKYAEEEVARITPAFEPAVTAVHSLAHAGRLTMVDVRVRRRKRDR